MMRDLVLHVGLPKTGTTVLQRELFPQHPGHLGGMSSRDNPGDLFVRFCELVEAFHTQQGQTGKLQPGRVSDWWSAALRKWWQLAKAQTRGTLVLSSEDLFAWYAGPQNARWPMMANSLREEGTRRGEHPMIEMLRTVADNLADEAKLRTIITLRNQPDFVGSHYAQMSLHLRRPRSKDLAAKVRRMLATDDQFLDWAASVEGLQSVCGRDGVHVAIFEDGLEAIAAEMSAFITPGWQPAISFGWSNRRRVGEGEWTVQRRPTAISVVETVAHVVWPPTRLARPRRALVDRLLPPASSMMLRTERATVSMSSELRTEVREAFAASNKRLAALIGRDLTALGY